MLYFASHAACAARTNCPSPPLKISKSFYVTSYNYYEMKAWQEYVKFTCIPHTHTCTHTCPRVKELSHNYGVWYCPHFRPLQYTSNEIISYILHVLQVRKTLDRHKIWEVIWNKSWQMKNEWQAHTYTYTCIEQVHIQSICIHINM